MKRTKLDELLRGADDGVAAPRLDGALSGRVRARAVRRRRVRAMGAGIAALVLVVTVGWMMFGRGVKSSKVEVAETRRRSEEFEEVKCLRREAAAHERLAARMEVALRAEERSKRKQRVPALAALVELSVERDVVAAALVRCGDRLRELDAAEAARSYRCVVVNFGESSFAVAAQERLAGMK